MYNADSAKVWLLTNGQTAPDLCFRYLGSLVLLKTLKKTYQRLQKTNPKYMLINLETKWLLFVKNEWSLSDSLSSGVNKKLSCAKVVIFVILKWKDFICASVGSSTWALAPSQPGGAFPGDIAMRQYFWLYCCTNTDQDKVLQRRCK